jgi:hypothetical protein
MSSLATARTQTRSPNPAVESAAVGKHEVDSVSGVRRGKRCWKQLLRAHEKNKDAAGTLKKVVA